MVSTIMLSDNTSIPIDAGIACLISKLLMEAVPKMSEFFFKKKDF
jgi:hypothetical protein